MLYVLEGPDSVGKSELSASLVARLPGGPGAYIGVAFPGRDPGTLGLLVHQLHHCPRDLGVERISPTSLQLLHIAAHVDAIERVILPAMARGVSVVLDRFWWSTAVYGRVLGVSEDALDAMIELERRAWRGVAPTAVFLITRPTPFQLKPDESLDVWQQLRSEYDAMGARESARHPVITIRNTNSREAAVREVVAQVATRS